VETVAAAISMAGCPSCCPTKSVKVFYVSSERTMKIMMEVT